MHTSVFSGIHYYQTFVIICVFFSVFNGVITIHFHIDIVPQIERE